MAVNAYETHENFVDGLRRIYYLVYTYQKAIDALEMISLNFVELSGFHTMSE
jgi:hypothetical protein